MSKDYWELFNTCKSVNKIFLDLVDDCRKPTDEIMENALVARSDFSEAESDFITYIAGFSHKEFAKGSYQKFRLSFLKGTKIFHDAANNRFHVKVLLNDQTADLEGLDLWHTADSLELPVVENRLQARDQSGCYVSLGEKLRHLSRDEAQRYLDDCDLGLYEYIVSQPIKLEKYTLVLHLANVSQNTPINLNRVFDGVSVCIFANSHDELPNLSFLKLKQVERLHPTFKNFVWYVIENEQSQDVVRFLREILANCQPIPYIDNEYRYLNALIPGIIPMLVSQITSEGMKK